MFNTDVLSSFKHVGWVRACGTHRYREPTAPDLQEIQDLKLGLGLLLFKNKRTFNCILWTWQKIWEEKKPSKARELITLWKSKIEHLWSWCGQARGDRLSLYKPPLILMVILMDMTMSLVPFYWRENWRLGRRGSSPKPQKLVTCQPFPSLAGSGKHTIWWCS